MLKQNEMKTKQTRTRKVTTSQVVKLGVTYVDNVGTRFKADGLTPYDSEGNVMGTYMNGGPIYDVIGTLYNGGFESPNRHLAMDYIISQMKEEVIA